MVGRDKYRSSTTCKFFLTKIRHFALKNGDSLSTLKRISELPGYSKLEETKMVCSFCSSRARVYTKQD